MVPTQTIAGADGDGEIPVPPVGAEVRAIFPAAHEA